MTSLKNLIALRKQYQGILSDSEVEWKIVDSENGIVKFERGSLKAIFNIGEKPAYFSADEVVFSNLVDQNNILQYGFVIYK